jgi:ATP-dependent DNA helicase PIF1
MRNNLKPIERRWLENFKKCPLVDKASGKFRPAVAYQLFYGRIDHDYPSDYPHNFCDFKMTCIAIELEDAVDKIVEFLQFIGIRIQARLINNHLSNFPGDFEKLVNKCHYILKYLAHASEDLDVNNPYRDNNGDIYFLLRIESGESITGGQLNLFEDIELPELYNRYITIPAGYENDPIVQKLFTDIETTDKSYFITGEAGTGKSTFIHYFSQNTGKKILMVAFTGIAAINIGGQTIHSFFRFPLKPLLPEDDEITIFKNYEEKYKIIEKIDTIIIDEVSMLRADILEAIDYSLRRNGGNPEKVFGGKQMIFVGDIFQLPPVTEAGNEAENILFKEFYKSEYFFDSPAYKKLNPSFFEFSKIHRQKDDLEFVGLLNRVRNCTADEINILRLNERFNPSYVPKSDEFVINLTSTNHIANAENVRKLEELNYTKYVFEAEITGEFKEDRYPTNRILELKKHAQIIFIKNDPERRWVNGTIAKVDFISNNLLEIRLQDGTIHQLSKVVWENRRYKYDRAKGRIVSEVLGTFTQYPIKLAWAITIHKSQGLTFDNVTIDLGTGAFVNGQLYTALSRCRTLSGITLKRKVRQEDIIADSRIINFYEVEKVLNGLQL